jgi:SAM-dependent methyltransferase
MIGGKQTGSRAAPDGAPSLWNANIHYHSLLVEAIPRDARLVLDVGCGDGILSAHLIRAGISRVIGLDLDGPVLERAKRRHDGVSIEWQQGDLFDIPFGAGSFDAVVSVATLHHLPAEAALARFAHLVKPGGTVAVVGLAANDWWDVPYAAVGLGARLIIGFARGYWKHSAPMVWPPPATYGEMKRIARRVLPGVRYRRHLLGRYSLIWRKPNVECVAELPD